MNRLLLLWSNTLLVLLEAIVLAFFASVFFKKNLSTVKFLISIILLVIFNIAALALLDKYFWVKALVLIIVDAIWLKISYIDLLSEECQSSSAFADKDMFPVRRGCLKKCMEAQYQFSVYDASHEKIGQEDIKNRKEMYGDNLTDAQLDQLETICDKINAAQYHTIWYRALQLDQSEDGGNLLSETMVQYWNDEITLDELVDRLTPRLKLYLDE